jgi:hypothetical protein
VLKEARNVAAVIPVEKGSMGMVSHKHGAPRQLQHHKVVQELGSSNSSSFSDDLPALDQDERNDFLGICCQELLARGTELLKRTRKGTSRSGHPTIVPSSTMF